MGRLNKAGTVSYWPSPKQAMQVNVLLFAAARQAADTDSILIEIPENARVSDVFSELEKKIPEIAALIPSCRIALDSSYVDLDTAVSAENEIALIPPVSGG